MRNTDISLQKYDHHYSAFYKKGKSIFQCVKHLLKQEINKPKLILFYNLKKYGEFIIASWYAGKCLEVLISFSHSACSGQWLFILFIVNPVFMLVPCLAKNSDHISKQLEICVFCIPTL